jgi:hypothetical protein
MAGIPGKRRRSTSQLNNIKKANESMSLSKIFGLDRTFNVVRVLGAIGNASLASLLLLDRRVSQSNNISAGMYRERISGSVSVTAGNASGICILRDLENLVNSLDNVQDNKKLQINEALLTLHFTATTFTAFYPYIIEMENGEIVAVGTGVSDVVDPVLLLETLSSGAYKYKFLDMAEPKPFYDNGTVRYMQTKSYDISKILQKYIDKRFQDELDEEDVHELSLGIIGVTCLGETSFSVTGALSVNYNQKVVRF